MDNIKGAEGSNNNNNELLAKDSRKHKVDYKWKKIIILIYIHLAGIYGLYLGLFHAKLWTIIWFFAFYNAAMLGTTAGCHRLWAHRSYKAKWPMKLILTIFQTAAFQGCIYSWVRDHRVHHKFTDTDADPYNARRGFFFSHIGWLVINKHPDVIKKSARIDCTDMEQDPFVIFQRKWYTYLAPFCCFLLPTLIPYWAWKETMSCAWHLTICTLCLNLNMTFAVNSVAHIWGTKPYDKSISPVNNIGVSFVTLGEGWHNYHHVFPWDYKTAELGNYVLDFATVFIDFFAFLGLAYDLRIANIDIVKKRILRNNGTTLLDKINDNE
ncbi:acyl-CoA Delta-9 desaturase-like [Anoplolepis gracilipes]|uniref:acyl-CoA Delta-9 desaturase-like n=1 Tax=Anoplolepis gracilipes TaxID=354296 RepID=UPI003B9F5DF9